MTNGEKIKEVFEIAQVDEGELYAYIWLPNYNEAEVSIDWWNAEYKEPNCSEIPTGSTTKNDLGVDCISRQVAIDAIRRIHPIDTDYDCTLLDKVDVMYVLSDLPSVTPQETIKGHWMPTYGNVKCSVCGSVKDSREVGKATHYCDFCGAKMVEPQESEDI